MKSKRLDHRFVEFMPEQLEAGILYISLAFATSAHRCCCGCGEEVVIPFTPHGWKMTFDGESISIHPSVGSWTLRCRSHYFINQGAVVESLPWNGPKVLGKQGEGPAANILSRVEAHVAEDNSKRQQQEVPLGFFSRLRRWICR